MTYKFYGENDFMEVSLNETDIAFMSDGNISFISTLGYMEVVTLYELIGKWIHNQENQVEQPRKTR